MSRSPMIWIFNALIVLCRCADHNLHILSKCSVSVHYGKTILHRNIQTEQITNGDILALR